MCIITIIMGSGNFGDYNFSFQRFHYWGVHYWRFHYWGVHYWRFHYWGVHYWRFHYWGVHYWKFHYWGVQYCQVTIILNPIPPHPLDTSSQFSLYSINTQLVKLLVFVLMKFSSH